MPKKIILKSHISTKELYNIYRNSPSAIERTHYQIIWLLSTGKSVIEVAKVTGYSKPWIYEIMARYNDKGIEGLGDLRKHNKGKEPLLSEFQQAQLHQVLANPPADGGLWNGRKVAEYMSQITGKEISRVRGWEYLKQMEYSLKVPRPQHIEVSLAEQLEWKKNSL